MHHLPRLLLLIIEKQTINFSVVDVEIIFSIHAKSIQMNAFFLILFGVQSHAIYRQYKQKTIIVFR